MPPSLVSASACDHAALDGSVYFMVSSTPDRASRIHRLLATMKKQTLPPAAVVLTIAAEYNTSRFSSRTFSMPATSIESARAKVLRHVIPRDLGPITKYHGHSLIQPDAIIVVGDDDMFYGSTFLEDYACAVARAPVGTVFSSGIDRDCLGRSLLSTCVMGFRGVGLRAGMLFDLPSMSIPPECFLADDLAISYYLAVVKRYEVRRLRLRTKYKFDNEFAWSNSSINAFHRERKFSVNRACAAALRRHHAHRARDAQLRAKAKRAKGFR